MERNQGMWVDGNAKPPVYGKNSNLKLAAAEKAFAAVERAERKMSRAAKAGWRWRIFRIRAEIDLSAARGEQPMAQKENFAELGRIYHVGRDTEGAVRPPTVTP